MKKRERKEMEKEKILHEVPEKRDRYTKHFRTGTKEYRLKRNMEGGADSKVMKIAVFI